MMSFIMRLCSLNVYIRYKSIVDIARVAGRARLRARDGRHDARTVAVGAGRGVSVAGD